MLSCLAPGVFVLVVLQVIFLHTICFFLQAERPSQNEMTSDLVFQSMVLRSI